MKTIHIVRLVLLFLSAAAQAGTLSEDKQAVELFRQAMPTGKGIAVVIGPTESLLQALCEAGQWRLFLPFSGGCEMRPWAEKAGLLGTRLFIGEGSLADNMANAVWVNKSSQGSVSTTDVLRMLQPGGKALVDGQVITKPVPSGMDDWSHFFHGPDNNPVSTDQWAQGPMLTQFIADPKFSPMPQVTVTAGGRVFIACGNQAMSSNQNASLNTLYAINAYNGVILWTRPLREGFLIHRCTMIATPEVLYLGDDESCKVIDAATGQVKREILAPEAESDGKVWKWMALAAGADGKPVLYALVGGKEVKVPTVKSTGTGMGGWPWGKWTGYVYDNPKTNTEFGRTLVAFDPVTGRKIWAHREEEYLDGRAVCMKGTNLYYFSPGKFLACLDTASGKVRWKNSDKTLLDAIGTEKPGQNASVGFSTASYLKCNDRYVFFAGAVRPNLVAARTKDGSVAWCNPGSGAAHLLLREEALYSVEWNTQGGKLDYDSGKLLSQPFPMRGACTRATSGVDAIYYRAGAYPYLGDKKNYILTEGTYRLDLSSLTATHIAPMRPPCQNGVIISNGMLYWGPWLCDCKISLYGNIALAPQGKLNTHPPAEAPGRLMVEADAMKVQPFAVLPGDWVTALGDNARTGGTATDLTTAPHVKWTYQPNRIAGATAPVVAGKLVFVADHNGVVRALESATGKLQWQRYTGGAIFFPPTVGEGRVFVGSADGNVYAFEAISGRPLWHYRVAPVERWIPMFDKLMSTWPVAGGVVVQEGVVYAAAGISSFDGTYVVALDAASGKPKWYNDTSGELSAVTRSGVSLQGRLAIREGKLEFTGGTVIGTAQYDLATGKCLNPTVDRVEASFATAFYPFYPEYAKLGALRRDYPDGKTLLCNPIYDTVANPEKSPGLCLLDTEVKTPSSGPSSQKASPLEDWIRTMRLSRPGGKKPPIPLRAILWKNEGVAFRGLAVGPTVVMGAGVQRDSSESIVTAIRIQDGQELWHVKMDGIPVRDGLALSAHGRIFVSTEEGNILALDTQ